MIDFTQTRKVRKERLASGSGRMHWKDRGSGERRRCGGGVPLEMPVGAVAARGALAPVAGAKAGCCGSRLETGWRRS